MGDATITYDPRGCFLPEHGITPSELAKLGRPLDEARDEVLADAQLWADGGRAAAAQAAAGRGVSRAAGSAAGRVPHARRQERGGADQGGGRSAERGASAAWSCWGSAGRTWGRGRCWRRAATRTTTRSPPTMRRGRPRIYFEGNNVDNDALLDLVRLLGEPRRRVGHRRHLQERRHAGDGGGVSDSAARAAGDAEPASGGAVASW